MDATQRWRAGTLALLAALVLAAQVGAVFRSSVHWDEFALLHQADLSLATGVFESGGRPGLATLALLPFVEHCDDEISVVRRARLLWVLFSVAFLAGVWVWTAALGGGWRDGALAVALLALVPAFLESSIQVRADQIALAGGAWGGAALLASRRRPLLALAAGLCFGAGLLASQKLLYLAALAALLAAGQLWLGGSLRPRREALRALLCALGVGALLLAYRLAIHHFFRLAPDAPAQAPLTASGVRSGLSIFDFYRHTIGWTQYVDMLPTLAPHALLLAGLVAVSWRGRGSGARERRRVVLAWAVLGLGVAVGLFHAAAFSYFWMTLGLFPAMALGLARAPLAGLAAPLRPRLRVLAAAALALLLVAPAVAESALRLRDTQAVQRESLAFVHRNFARDAAGFHPERALVCQAGAQPGLTWFSQHIYRHFGDGDARRARNVERLEEEFRDTPVLFLLESFRLNQFPLELRRFWAENYQPYRGSVFVAGHRLAGARGEHREFELLAPGRYRWLPAREPRSVAVDGHLLEPGQVMAFASGRHEASFVEEVPDGMLVLALEDPPGPAPLRFYP